MPSSRLALLLIRRHRRQAHPAREAPARLRQAYIILGALLVALVCAIVLGSGALYASLTRNLPSPAQLPALFDPQNGLLLHPTQVYDRTGATLLLSLEAPGAPRRYLPLDSATTDRLSPELARLAVAALEPGFWQDSGYSLADLTSQQPVTLAEQLADSLLLDQEPSSLARALRMRLLAAQMTTEYGPARVLEWYLNGAAYGHLAFGAESAARLYLGKSASQLNLGEAALLVAVLQAPALNPLDAPEAALERQRALLEHLVESGAITVEEYQQAAETPLPQPPAAPQPLQPARAFTAAVLEQLAARFGQARLERGGLRITTTLDLDQQRQLTCAVQTQLARLEGKPSAADLANCETGRLLPSLPPNLKPYPPGLRASALLYEPSSGQALAYVGDSTTGGELTLSTAHQPGTALTPFLAMAAFSRGMSPASLSWDIPGLLPAQYEALSAPGSGKYTGPLRFRNALAADRLAPLEQTLLQIGAGNVWRLAEPLGLAGLGQEQDPAALLFGGGDTSLMSLAQAYAVFAGMGSQAGQRLAPGAPLQPILVLSVTDIQGRTLFQQGEPEVQAVLSPALAYLVHNVLSDEPARWPELGYPNALEIGRPAGAKVGLADSGKQAWAVGYTRQRLAVTWLSLPPGGDTAQPLDPRASAGLWHALMQYAQRDLPALGWDPPPGISSLEVCDPSGYLPTAACPGRASEIFLDGNEPTGPDTLYQVFQVNRETGLLATVFTPPELVEDRTYLVLPPEAQAWGRLAGLPVPPAGYDRIQPPPPSPVVHIDEPGQFAYLRGKVSVRGTAAGAGFASYRLQVGAGLNPAAWINIGQGSAPVNGGELAAWDTAGLDGLYALRLQVVRSDNTLETAIVQVTLDNQAPTVGLSNPLPGTQTTPAGGVLTFQAEASDNVGVVRVEFWLDGSLAGKATDAPYALPWYAVQGAHTLQAVVYDAAGNKGESDVIEFGIGK